MKDASKLKDDIVSREGAMSHVAHLLNVWATFVPSNAVSQISRRSLQCLHPCI